MGIHLENNDSLESQYYHTPSTLIYKINWNYIAYLFKPYWPFLCQLFFSRQNRSIILKSEQGHKTYSHFKWTRKLLRLYWHNNKNAALHELQTVFFLSNRLKPYIYFKCVGMDTKWAEDSFDIHWLIYIFILQLSKLTVEPNLHFLINSFFIW